MARYKPSVPFSVPCILLKPTYTTAYGVKTKQMPAADKGELFFASVRSFGGTERNVNGAYVIEATANIETYFRPDITSECHVIIDGAEYEILGEPENIELRNQFLMFKVRKIAGGA